MDTLIKIIEIGIYAVMAVSVLAAIAVVTLPNLFHAALAFVVVLVGIAGVFIALHADFLALAQILIYVGAVMTLVIFAVMLTQRLSDKNFQSQNSLSIPAFFTSLIFFITLAKVILITPWPIRESSLAAKVTVSDLGVAFMTQYVFPFELISVILISALIGAVVIAKKEQAS